VDPEPEVSSPFSQESATGPCTKPTESNPPEPTFLRSILIQFSHPRLGIPSGRFPSGFLIKTLYTFLSSYPTFLKVERESYEITNRCVYVSFQIYILNKLLDIFKMQYGRHVI
jgi:hypothetical protein